MNLFSHENNSIVDNECFSLLDVAMVIIITMICKIYFPALLERSSPAAMPETRTPLYRRVNDEEIMNRNSSYYSSDEEEENTGSGGGAPDEIPGGNGNDPLNQSFSNLDGKNTGPSPQKFKRNPNMFPDKLAFEQENTSKMEVMRRLAFCVIMLNVTFVTWGVLQERMLTRRYPRFTGEYFTYSYALVFTSRFWTLIMSGFLMMYLKPTRSSSTIIYEYSFPSISNMLSSWCQYESLRYVSFPAVTLFKSFKLAPVMAMGKFLGNKQCEFVWMITYCSSVRK